MMVAMQLLSCNMSSVNPNSHFNSDTENFSVRSQKKIARFTYIIRILGSAIGRPDNDNDNDDDDDDDDDHDNDNDHDNYNDNQA